jgi:hypothetical protein
MQENVEVIDVWAPNSIMKKDQMETTIVVIKEQSANNSYFG